MTAHKLTSVSWLVGGLWLVFISAMMAGCYRQARPADVQAPEELTPTVYTPPPEICTFKSPPERTYTPPQDEAFLSVARSIGGGGLSLEARGATAGQVLVEMAQVMGQAIHVKGWGAGVRIYGHVDDWPPVRLYRAVLLASGLVEDCGGTGDLEVSTTSEEPTSSGLSHCRGKRAGLTLLTDPISRAVNEWTYLRTTESSETVVMTLSTESPAEMAETLARTVLECSGTIVSLPKGSEILVRTSRLNAAKIQEVFSTLEKEDATEDRTWELHRTPPDWRTFDVKCPDVGEKVAPVLPRSQAFATGEASGDLLRSTAAARGRDVIVGCGGERPAFIQPPDNFTLEMLAGSLAFHPIGDDDVYVSRDYYSAAINRPGFNRLSESFRPETGVRLLHVDRPQEFAVSLEALRDDLLVAPYVPMNAVLVFGTTEDLEVASAFAEEWRDLTGQLRSVAPRESHTR